MKVRPYKEFFGEMGIDLQALKDEQGMPDVDDLTAMVREVNATQVEVQDRLSDNVYKYSVEYGIVLA